MPDVMNDIAERRQGNRMRIVRVQDVGLQLLDDARELPSGVQINLGTGSESNEVVPFRCARRELAFGIRDEHRAVSPLAQTEHGEQHLSLSAPPGLGRVDVNREHVSPAEFPTTWRI